ncbi:MAG: hypothetical protein DI589_06710 [Shinella sp.]|nr:MAG: hypothetical protein DI589_06710 [Shinella sp.]
MSVHYDVEKIIADLKANAANTVLPPNVNPEAHVILRNRAISHEIMRMVFTEENRGTDAVMQIKVMAHFAAEFVRFIQGSYVDETARPAVEAMFRLHMSRVLASMESGDTINSTITVEPMEGGHA